MKIFCGFDSREAVGFHAFVHSVLEHSPGVQIIPLSGQQRDGTNAFTYARFMVPELCTWAGKAIFVDACDMLLRADIRQLFDMADTSKAVQVVKHDYTTKHERKYVGTEMEASNESYPRKNWSSVILFNAGHNAHFNYRESLRGGNGKFLHRFEWLKDDEIGELPVEWNWLDEYGENPEAKLLHWTTGIPGFHHYRHAPHADEWKSTVRKMMKGMD